MIESRCGILCNTCKWQGETCRGCLNIEKPFWGDTCEVKSCCEGKKLSHCGQCSLFPCETITAFSYDAKEGDEGQRLKQCEKWAL